MDNKSDAVTIAVTVQAKIRKLQVILSPHLPFSAASPAFALLPFLFGSLPYTRSITYHLPALRHYSLTTTHIFLGPHS
jgi:hypothetical protein